MSADVENTHAHVIAGASAGLGIGLPSGWKRGGYRSTPSHWLPGRKSPGSGAVRGTDGPQRRLVESGPLLLKGVVGSSGVSGQSRKLARAAAPGQIPETAIVSVISWE